MSSSAIPRSAGAQPSKALNLALWIVQLLLFCLFGFAGYLKLTQPVDRIAPMIPWTQHVPEGLVRFIGLSETLGALGMLLPAITRIKPTLTPLAAAGLTTMMILAVGYHLANGEAPVIGGPIILGALAAFIAWGRFRRAPIAPR